MKKYKIIVNGEEKEITADNLVAKGTDISLGTTLIVTGSFYNSLEMVQDGISSNNFNINLQNSLGETPLHFASKQNFIDIVKILLKNGAQFIPDDEGEYPTLPEELEALQMYYFDIIRGEDEIKILKTYDSIDAIIADYDNIFSDLFIYNDDGDSCGKEDFKKFASIDEVIKDLKKTLAWKHDVIQEEIEKL